MRRYLSLFLIAVFLGGLTMAMTSCMVVVKRPPRPAMRVEMKSVRPAPRAVWVAGHWQWKPRGKRWVWVPGHWRRRR
ncbi:hypothetical protein K8S19_10190 [bacterium]|nr:hypothetical protein [bacterium]